MSKTSISSKAIDSRVLLVHCERSRDLCEAVAKRLKVAVVAAKVTVFASGETRVQVPSFTHGKNGTATRVVIVFQSAGTAGGSENHALIELLMAVRAALVAGAIRVIAVTPLLFYARQDHAEDSMVGPLSARLVADLLSTAGANSVVTMDIHSPQTEGFFGGPGSAILHHLSSEPVIIKCLKKLKHNRQKSDQPMVLVAPDAGY